jgi:hypothetical protein
MGHVLSQFKKACKQKIPIDYNTSRIESKHIQPSHSCNIQNQQQQKISKNDKSRNYHDRMKQHVHKDNDESIHGRNLK